MNRQQTTSAARAPGPRAGGFAPARGGRLVGTALAIGAVTMAARTVGFARGIVFVRTVGATCVGDTYYAANTIPNIVFEIVAGGALASAVVPLLAGPVDAGDASHVRRTASALLTWALLLLVPVSVAGVLLARPLMGALAGSSLAAYDRASVVALGARMLVVFMPQVALYGVAVVLTGVLQAHRRFLGPAVAPLLSSVVVIAAYAVYAAEGPAVLDCGGVPTGRLLTLTVGTTLGVAALAAGLLVPLRATGVRLRPTLSFPPGVARRARALALAGVSALAAQQLSTAVVLRLSYGGPAGTLVLYNLAWTLFLLPWAVLAVPVATTAFPGLSASADAGDHAGFARAAAATTRVVLLVSAGAAAVLAATALPAARVLVLHAAGHPDPHTLARAILAFAPGLVGYGLVAHLGRALYARHEGRLAAVATASGWAVVVAVDLALVTSVPAGHRLEALAVGNTVGMTVAGALLAAALTKAAGRDCLAGVARAAAAGLLAAVLAAGCGVALARTLPGSGAVDGIWQAVVVALAVALGYLAVVAAVDRRDVAEAWALRGRRG